MFESIFQSTANTTTISAIIAILTILQSLVLGVIISFTYIKTKKKDGYSQNFAVTLIFLPIIVSAIILLIGSNVARAFSLAGAFSIIRFRSTPGDSKDISYVLFTMAVGLAIGCGSYIYSVFFTLSICIIMIVLNKVNFGAIKEKNETLKITIPEDLDYEGAFDDIFSNFTSFYELNKVKLIDLGSLFELTYSIKFKEKVSQKEFIDELRCRNGNLNIRLLMNKYNKEL